MNTNPEPHPEPQPGPSTRPGFIDPAYVKAEALEGTEKVKRFVWLDENRRTELSFQHATAHVQIAAANAELQLAKQEHRAAIKGPAKAAAAALKELQENGYEEEVACYRVPDFDRRKIKLVTEYGEVVAERPMKAEERENQYRIPVYNQD